MYIFIKGELTTVSHLPDEKRVIDFAFVVDNTFFNSWEKEITRPLTLSFKGFEAIVSMLKSISANKFVANFHFTKPPSNLSPHLVIGRHCKISSLTALSGLS
jgi:hypothetical protein